jgi:aspartate oxidase
MRRPESRGLNYNLDYPNPNPDWAQRDTVLRR